MCVCALIDSVGVHIDSLVYENLIFTDYYYSVHVASKCPAVCYDNECVLYPSPTLAQGCGGRVEEIAVYSQISHFQGAPQETGVPFQGSDIRGPAL